MLLMSYSICNCFYAYVKHQCDGTMQTKTLVQRVKFDTRKRTEDANPIVLIVVFLWL